LENFIKDDNTMIPISKRRDMKKGFEGKELDKNITLKKFEIDQKKTILQIIKG
jgi:hypothetical protein